LLASRSHGLTSGIADADHLRAFRQGLKETGYVEGENVASPGAGQASSL